MTEQVKSGVGVVVIKEGKILIGKRKGSHGKGFWAFPGGHLEVDDYSMKTCGEREVFEETGIVCNVYSPDGYREELFTTFEALGENNTKVYTTVYLISDYLHGGAFIHEDKIKPMEPNKCEYWIWVTLDELIKIVNENENEIETLSWIPLNQIIHYTKDKLNEHEV